MEIALMSISNQRAIVVTTLTGIGFSVLYFVDPIRFRQYVVRPVYKVWSSLVTVVGFVGNIAWDLGSPKKEEQWKESLQQVVDYLEASGLSKEWGMDIPDFLIPLVLLLNKLQYDHFPRAIIEDKSTSVKVLKEGEHYMKYATAVYGREMILSAQLELDNIQIGPEDTLSDAIAKHCQVNPNDIWVQQIEYGDSTEYLQHLVVVDHKEKMMVLAVRGTFSLSSAIVDLAAYSIDFCGGRAHSGMAKMAFAVVEKASESLKARMAEVPEDYELVVCGHSLGAGVACLITILLHSEQGKSMMDGRIPPRIRCMAFAPPPVFYPFEAAPEAVRNTTAFVHNMDCVPSLSINAIRRLVKSINVLNIHFQDSPAATSPSAVWKILEDFEAPLVEALTKSLDQRLAELEGAEPLLIPSAEFLWLREIQEEKYKTFYLDVDYYSERLLDVHSRMVSDHMAPKYENAFKCLLQNAYDHSA